MDHKILREQCFDRATNASADRIPSKVPRCSRTDVIRCRGRAGEEILATTSRPESRTQLRGYRDAGV